MKYRDAKNLTEGRIINRISDGMPIVVKSIEIYGQHKTVKINGTADNGEEVSLFNDEVKA